MIRCAMAYLLLVLLVVPPAVAQERDSMSMTVSWNAAKKTFIASMTISSDVTAATQAEIPGLIQQLNTGDSVAQSKTMAQLIKAGDKAVPALRKAARSSDMQLRQQAATTLLFMSTPKSREALRQTPAAPFIADLSRNNGEGELSLMVLPAIGSKEALAVARVIFDGHLQSTADNAWNAGKIETLLVCTMFAHQRALLPEVERCLTSPNAGVRARAIMAHVLLSDGKDTERYIAMANDPDPGVRNMVLLPLSALDAPQAGEALITRMLTDEEKGIREMAAMIVGGMKQDTVVPALVQASHDAEPNVRVAAARGLGRFPTAAPAREALTALLQDEAEAVRIAAAAALAQDKP